MNTNPWVFALQKFEADISAQVTCPNCDHACLEVTDIFPVSDSKNKERILTCPACRATIAARMPRKDSELQMESRKDS